MQNGAVLFTVSVDKFKEFMVRQCGRFGRAILFESITVVRMKGRQKSRLQHVPLRKDIDIWGLDSLLNINIDMLDYNDEELVWSEFQSDQPIPNIQKYDMLLMKGFVLCMSRGYWGNLLGILCCVVRTSNAIFWWNVFPLQSRTRFGLLLKRKRCLTLTHGWLGPLTTNMTLTLTLTLTLICCVIYVTICLKQA